MQYHEGRWGHTCISKLKTNLLFSLQDTINCYVNKKVSDNIVDSMRFFWRDLWETHFSKLCLDFENIHALYELVDDSGENDQGRGGERSGAEERKRGHVIKNKGL